MLPTANRISVPLLPTPALRTVQDRTSVRAQMHLYNKRKH